MLHKENLLFFSFSTIQNCLINKLFKFFATPFFSPLCTSFPFLLLNSFTQFILELYILKLIIISYYYFR
ncbi:hypothetical protein BDC45DRAFT_500615 [Circinella umbellata]|nr:hypothetical protein BDC45DRAFT_500615 [Circinella umbellata]